MADNVLPEDIKVRRDGNHLILEINGTTDKLTMQHFFYNDEYKIEQVKFANGTVWDVPMLKDKVRYINGTEAGEVIGGYETNDILNGLGGNDAIYGHDGHDIINGGDGNDALFGGNGNDTINSGAGNDYMEGATGNDTYIFGRGSGQDAILDYDRQGGNVDIIQFKADITKKDIAFFRQDRNLIIDYGNGDRVTIQNQADTNYAVERFQLNDGLYLTNTDINRIIQDMTVFSKDHGIAMTSIEQVRANQDLMNLVVNSWQG